MEGKYFKAKNRLVFPAIILVFLLSAFLLFLIFLKADFMIVNIFVFLTFLGLVFIAKNIEFKGDRKN